MKDIFIQFMCAATILFIAAGQANAQNAMTLQAVGIGEKVSVAAGGKLKIVNLEKDFAADFTVGGDAAPHRYTTLLSIKKRIRFIWSLDSAAAQPFPTKTRRAAATRRKLGW